MKQIIVAGVLLTQLLFITDEWICPKCFWDNPPGIPNCEACGRKYPS